MVAGVTLQTKLTIAGSLAGANDLGTPKLKLEDIIEQMNLTPGTDTTGKADLLFSDTRTLAASATEDIDLAGVLSTAFGATITGAELVLLYVKAADANNAANNVNVTRPAANGVPIFLAAGDGRGLKAGEFMLIQSPTGIPITAATADLITITNSAGTNPVTYDIVVVARTVAA